MQIKKAGAVAIGAIATVAAMGTSAAASPITGPGQATASAKAFAEPKADIHALTDALGLNGDFRPQPLLSIFGGSSLQVSPAQFCGSTVVGGLGAAAATGSPNTVLGDCDNSRVTLTQDEVPALISLFDNSSIRLAPWQFCGSTVAAGVGAAAALNSPNTVTGDCDNSSTLIKAAEGDEDGPRSLISIFSGSSLNVASWQACGSTAVFGASVASSFSSPTTVIGRCKNGVTRIQRAENPATLPVLSNIGLNIGSLQACGSDSLLGLGGLAPAINSPATVLGGCENGPMVTNASDDDGDGDDHADDHGDH